MTRYGNTKVGRKRNIFIFGHFTTTRRPLTKTDQIKYFSFIPVDSLVLNKLDTMRILFILVLILFQCNKHAAV